MQVNIKIDDELYRKLKANAKQNSRTITAQLGVILSNALETQEELSIETQETQNKKHRQLIENYNNNYSNNIEEEDPYKGWK